MMADEYRNLGPVARAGAMRDVIINSNYNYTNGIVSPTMQPKKISFKNVLKPHRAFIGRVKYIKSAVKYLTRPVTADVQIQFPCLVIHALGGYGKTQTARKIVSVCRKKRKFQHFIWIDCEDDQSTKNGFVAAMKQVGLNAAIGSDATDFDSLMHHFYNLLGCRSREKCLIIFDNVEDFDKIMTFLPLNRRASNFAVLMTSQRPFTRESYGHVRNQPLDLMQEQEAMQLVENILGTTTMDSEKDKKLLVERSGRIVLVLCVMTSTIKYQRKSKSDYSINDYLREMCDQPIQYSDESNDLDLTYKKSFQKIVQVAVKKLNALDGPTERVAVEIFDRLAYCSSDNPLEVFVQQFLQDICDNLKNVDMKLPMKPVDNGQIIRMAIEKLSEFSLAQIDSNELTVHRWIQASRRLDLKYLGVERSVVEKLLFIVPDMGRNTSIIWQYVVDNYPDLVPEFYARKGCFKEFPIFNVDLLEKIIPGLTQRADFEKIENYAEEIEEILCRQMSYGLDAVKRTTNVFNFEVSKKSTKLLSAAISNQHLDVLLWLVNEELCIPEECHLRQCFHRSEFDILAFHLQQLKELDNEIEPETNLVKIPLERVFNKFNVLCRRSPTSKPIASLEISFLLFNLRGDHPLRIQLCSAIEKNYGENVLKRILHSNPNQAESEALLWIWWLDLRQSFETIRIILNAVDKLKPNIELNRIKEKYSLKNLLECLCVCGRTHCNIKQDKAKTLEHMEGCKWSDLHRAAYNNNLTDIKSIDPTFIESKDKFGSTPLIIAVKAGVCKATKVLLGKYSANVNVMDDHGKTPLAYAIEYRHPSICQILLSRGAKTQWRTESGSFQYALHMAVESLEDYDGSEPEEIIDALLTSNGCDICATDSLGNNVLHMLVQYYYTTRYKPNHRVLQSILSANAALVDIENNDAVTPVQLAMTLKAQYFDNHWHVASLKSFILEIYKANN